MKTITETNDKASFRPQGILDPNFKYVPSAQTDVTQTWRKYGWTPIERTERYYESTEPQKKSGGE